MSKRRCGKKWAPGVALVFFTCFLASAQAPLKLSSSMGAGGSSGYISMNGNTWLVQQSIGQGSVTGSVQTQNHILHQGFLQPRLMSGAANSESSLQAIIYPNPFSEQITIRLKEYFDGNLSITLSDMLGRTVFTCDCENASVINLNPGALGAGQYVLKLHTHQKLYIKKLIKE